MSFAIVASRLLCTCNTPPQPPARTELSIRSNICQWDGANETPFPFGHTGSFIIRKILPTKQKILKLPTIRLCFHLNSSLAEAKCKINAIFFPSDTRTENAYYRTSGVSLYTLRTALIYVRLIVKTRNSLSSPSKTRLHLMKLLFD